MVYRTTLDTVNHSVNVIFYTLQRAISLSLAASEWAFQSDNECDLNFTINGQCTGGAPECALWIGFGSNTEYIMLNINIEDKNNPTNEIIAAPSVDADSAANGDITDYFSKQYSARDFDEEAVDRFSAMTSWTSLSSTDDGWPVPITFRSSTDSVDVYWDGVLLKSWNSFAIDSDLIFLLSHNLRNDEYVEIQSIDINQECDGGSLTSSPTTPPTAIPTVGPYLITPLFNNTDSVSASISDDVSTDTNHSKWTLNSTEIDQWYVG